MDRIINMRKGSEKLKLIRTLQVVFSDLLKDLKGTRKGMRECACVPMHAYTTPSKWGFKLSVKLMSAKASWVDG